MKLERDDYGRVLERYDVKWAHPECDNGMWNINEMQDPSYCNGFLDIADAGRSREERFRIQKEYEKMFPDIMSVIPEDIEGMDVEYEGCPEEPDAKGHAYVRWPKNRDGGKMPVVLYIIGGGLATCGVCAAPVVDLVRRFHALVIAPAYRTSLEAEYPAAINDVHAAYCYLEKNAEKLNIDLDRVVIFGESAGGQLALCLAFRLKRYGSRPRGTVALVPITEERATYECSKMRNGSWDAEALRSCYRQYLGNSYNSPLLGPEGLANRATVEDCVGLCPVAMYTGEHDPGRDGVIDFASKLYKAGVFCDLRVNGGVAHGFNLFRAFPEEAGMGHLKKTCVTFSNDVCVEIQDFLDHDLRRAWITGDDVKNI